MGTMASQITSLTTVYSTVYSGSKKTSKLRVTDLCAGNSLGTGEFPAQMASNAQNISIWCIYIYIYIYDTTLCIGKNILSFACVALSPQYCRDACQISKQKGDSDMELWCFLYLCPNNNGAKNWNVHHSDLIMGAIVSQITSLTIVYSTVYSDADQRKHQSSASLAFVWGIHRGPVNSPHKRPVTRKMFSFDDFIMRWFETPSHSLWRHWNADTITWANGDSLPIKPIHTN